MKPLLIVNPRSAGGKTGETFEAMRAPIERAIGEVEVARTERSRHATEIAKDAALAGRAIVIALGGDGTIHEVVNGLMQAKAEGASATRLGIIGQGTGGDFRKTLGLEHRLDRYAEVIAAGKTTEIDVGRFTCGTEEGGKLSAYFVNILSVGIGGLVDRYVATSSRMLGGTVAYFAASLRGLVESAIGHLACTIHLGSVKREQEIATRSMAICNGRFFGSGMEVAPMAKLDDGRFEVVDFGAASRLRFATVSSKVYSGEHINHPDVSHFACDKLEMELLNREALDKFLLDVDGEPLGRMPLAIELMPRALHVFTP